MDPNLAHENGLLPENASQPKEKQIKKKEANADNRPNNKNTEPREKAHTPQLSLSVCEGEIERA